jgi:hypothetical protein
MENYSPSFQYLAEFFSECEVYQLTATQKIKTHTLCSITIFTPRKSQWLWPNVQKYCRARQATD